MQKEKERSLPVTCLVVGAAGGGGFLGLCKHTHS